MKKQVVLILAMFGLWSIGSSYWYVCKIKYLCQGKSIVTVEKASINEVGGTDAVSDLDLEPGDMNVPFYFSKDLSEPIVTSDTRIELSTMVEDLKNTGKVLITGHKETSLGNMEMDGVLREKRIKSTIAQLLRSGISSEQIVVVEEGTLAALLDKKYQLPDRRVVLIIGENEIK